MNQEQIVSIASAFANESPLNFVLPEKARREDLVGFRMYDVPIFGFGEAADPMFYELKESHIIGDHFRIPIDWLPQANTVVSFFAPFSDNVRKSNASDWKWPSDEWMHARIDGQAFILAMCHKIAEELEQRGFAAVIPAVHPDFRSWTAQEEGPSFTSNWSERHIAYVCGLGTFSLSKGLITRKGIAGRFGSIITDAKFERTLRSYTEYEEYCTKCGACISHCPPNAITLKEGKAHDPCSRFLDTVHEKEKPYYGCGKCQVRVPCEDRVPKR